MNCPQCGAALEPSENFCAQCGNKLRTTPEDLKAMRARARLSAERGRASATMRKGRGWILAVSILTLIGGIAMYFLAKSKVEKDLRDAEGQLSHLTPEERDEVVRQNTGMTWQQVVAHDRGMVTQLLVVNTALAVIYFGLWIWAKRNVFAAALTALLIFITVVVVSALLEPASLLQGILIKILVVIGLSSAVSAGYRARKLSGKLA